MWFENIFNFKKIIGRLVELFEQIVSEFLEIFLSVLKKLRNETKNFEDIKKMLKITENLSIKNIDKIS